MKKLNIGIVFLIMALFSIKTIRAQEKTAKCTDFKGYIYTHSYSKNNNKSEYWFILKYDGVLNEDCKIYYQTSNKTSKFKWPENANRKIITKGKTEYVISKNGFYYGNYNDKHRVYSYTLGKKFEKGFWKDVIDAKYKTLDWKITTDTQEKKK